MRYIAALFFTFLLPCIAWANCTTLNVSTWDKNERSVLNPVVRAAVGEDITARYLIAEQSVEICSSIDVTSLNQSTLQTQAQAYLIQRDADDLARYTLYLDAQAKLLTNTACNATFAQVDSRLDQEKATIQTDIDASTNIATAKIAMTTLNNRTNAIEKKLAECIIAIMKILLKQ